MNHQISVQTPSQEATEILENDYLMALMHARIAKIYTDSLMDYRERIPETVLNSCFKVCREINDLERKILNAVPRNGNWLRKEINKDKMLDIANATELILRIGKEENMARYEEFLSLLIDCLDTVLYTQKNRGNISFYKYKALFKLITSELKLDVAKQPSQVIFRNGEIYLKTTAPDAPNEIA